MSLSIGIVGLPNVGKSTLFKAVTNKQVDIQNYPFTTIEPNVGVVEVPDERIDRLAEISKSQKKIYATVQFTDIAGLVKGAAAGEGLGNKFLANIREVDAIVQVVRAFASGDILHVHETVDPVRDIGIINAELILADLDTVVKRLETEKKKRGEIPAGLERFATELQKGSLISSLALDEHELLTAREMNLLTAKRFIYVVNVDDAQLTENWQPPQELKDAMKGEQFVVMCNKLELELSELDAAEKKSFLAELGLPESGLDRLIKTAYSALDLISFLTTGEKETRAWTCTDGDLIPRASRAIHTDFEKLFIRAEVTAYDDLVAAGSLARAREHGKLRTEGKDYRVKDGDVVEILIGK